MTIKEQLYIVWIDDKMTNQIKMVGHVKKRSKSSTIITDFKISISKQ